LAEKTKRKFDELLFAKKISEALVF